jgi:hypothetical protein
MNNRELLAALKAAKGVDRKIDRAINRIANPGSGNPETPKYTGSINAALAFAERMLPGWEWRSGSRDADHANDWPWAELLPPGWDGGDDYHGGNAPTAPLAIIIATLEALIAREESNAD